MERKLAKEFNNKGFDLFKKGTYEEAIGEFDKALELNPKYKESLYNKALALFLLKKHEESLNEINKALSINEKYSKAINLKGLILTSLNRFYDAVIEYNKQTEVVSSEDGSFYFNKGIALSNFDCYEAIENFKKAIEYNFDVEQSQKELSELEKKICDLNEMANDCLHEKSEVSIENQLRLYHFYTVNKLKSENELQKHYYEGEIKKLTEKLSQLDDLFHEKLVRVLENKENLELETPENDFTQAFNACNKQELESHFSLDPHAEALEEITLSTKLLKEHFSSEENFFCKLCNNLIVSISQCAKCEILYCKRCISAKLEVSDLCPNCGEAFELGNVPKITKNILNGFKLACPFNCEEVVFYNNIFAHLKECGNRGKVFLCNTCHEKILIPKLNCESDYLRILFEHVELCPQKNSLCKYCNQELIRKDLNLHLENCEERNIKCDKCLFNYPFKMTLSVPHDETHCEEIRKLRKNLELFGKKNGI